MRLNLSISKTRIQIKHYRKPSKVSLQAFGFCAIFRLNRRKVTNCSEVYIDMVSSVVKQEAVPVTTQTGKKRLVYLDAIRIFACFLVIVNHTNSFIFMARQPSVTWFASIAYFFVSKPAVLLFIMVSGAVLLGKEESYKAVFARALRMVAILLFSSVCYFVYYTYIKQQGHAFEFTEVTKFLDGLIKGPVETSLWYLYLYIGLILMLPLLRPMVKALGKKDYYYIIGLFAVIMGTIPIITRYFPGFQISGYLKIPFITSFVAVFLAGYFINKMVVTSGKKALLFAVGYVALLAFQTVATYFEYRINSAGYLFYDNTYLSTLTVSSIFLFYIFKWFFERRVISPKVSKLITEIGACTFGMYLVSSFIIGELYPMYTALSGYMHVVFAMIIYEVCVFGIGLGFTYLIRKIPFVRKFI